jgi:hypothetical protein
MSFRRGWPLLQKERGEVHYSKIASETGQGSPTEATGVGGSNMERPGKGKPESTRYGSRINITTGIAAIRALSASDGTFVVTTYGHWAKIKNHIIVSVRVRMDELDRKYPGIVKVK